MVIKKTNERTFYEPMTSVNIATKRISLQKSGAIRYHDGTILIRNGRLVDSNSLQSSGNAFVATDGTNQSQFANVVHITNDGFQSPNLVNHTIYYGKISSTRSYGLTLTNAMKLSNNQWENVAMPSFSFSNDTAAVEDFRASVSTIIARDEMLDHIGDYGYFYIADKQIVAAHLIGPSTSRANLVSVGRFDGI